MNVQQKGKLEVKNSLNRRLLVQKNVFEKAEKSRKELFFALISHRVIRSFFDLFRKIRGSLFHPTKMRFSNELQRFR